MDEIIIKQILQIRDTGLTNMFDIEIVKKIAYEFEFFELVCFLMEYRREYVNFILTGEVQTR